jgi:hypothetical protein
MAFIHGKNSGVAVGRYLMSTFLRDATMSTDVDMAETSVYGNTNKTFIPGLASTTVALGGLWDSAALKSDEAFAEIILDGVATPVSLATSGFTHGNIAYTIGADQSSFEIATPVTDVAALTAQFQSRVDPSGGKRGHVFIGNGAALTATGSTASIDNAAGTTNGLGWSIHVIANDRSTSSTFIVEDSPNDSVWTQVGSSFVVNSGTTSSTYLVEKGTTIDRYLRASYTLTAGTGSMTVVLVATRH